MQGWKAHADWSLIPDFKREAIIAYVDHGQPEGEFIEALFSNQFTLVCLSADLCSKQRLLGYAKFLVEHIPAVCQGSPQAYADWVAIGGMEGFAAEVAKAIT